MCFSCVFSLYTFRYSDPMGLYQRSVAVAIQWDCLSALALWRGNGIAVANLSLWRFNGIASALDRWLICCRESVAVATQWVSAALNRPPFCCRESVAAATQWVSAALNRRPFCCRESVAALLLVVAISRREDWAVALLTAIRYIACQGTGPRQAPLFCGHPSFKTGR